MPLSLRVAIADDDREMRDSIQQMLCKMGHDVVAVADSGESLINQCRFTNPDVVITSTLTREMYGSDAAAALYKIRPIPIILYSSHCEPGLVLNAEHKHVFMYLVKPICEEHLQAAINECNRVRSNERPREDEVMVEVGAASNLSDGVAPLREQRRPSYRQRPR